MHRSKSDPTKVASSFVSRSLLALSLWFDIQFVRLDLGLSQEGDSHLGCNFLVLGELMAGGIQKTFESPVPPEQLRGQSRGSM